MKLSTDDGIRVQFLIHCNNCRRDIIVHSDEVEFFVDHGTNCYHGDICDCSTETWLSMKYICPCCSKESWIEREEDY